MSLRYSAAACRPTWPTRSIARQMRGNTDRMLSMIDAAVAGSAPFLPVRLVVFPEFAHAAPVFPTVESCCEKLAVPIPNEHTDRLAEGAGARRLHPERVDARSGSAVAGRRLQHDVPDWTGRDSLQVPQGQPVDSLRGPRSPHDLRRYDEPLFPVADTPIGRIGCAICYDWLFPEAIRQLAANGAEVLVRVSAYMDPWGATEPMNWWTIVNRCRALENTAYVVAANQGASLRHYPPYSWPGGSQVVDFDGRLLAEASPGPGERIVVAPIDISAVRHERDASGPPHAVALADRGVPVYGRHVYPPAVPGSAPDVLSYERNNLLIDTAKARLTSPHTDSEGPDE